MNLSALSLESLEPRKADVQSGFEEKDQNKPKRETTATPRRPLLICSLARGRVKGKEIKTAVFKKKKTKTQNRLAAFNF